MKEADRNTTDPEDALWAEFQRQFPPQLPTPEMKETMSRYHEWRASRQTTNCCPSCGQPLPMPDFAVGDRVIHDSRGPGVVTAVTGAGVAVQYDATILKRDGTRAHSRGLYDQRWFRMCPNMLHRHG